MRASFVFGKCADGHLKQTEAHTDEVRYLHSICVTNTRSLNPRLPFEGRGVPFPPFIPSNLIVFVVNNVCMRAATRRFTTLCAPEVSRWPTRWGKDADQSETAAAPLPHNANQKRAFVNSFFSGVLG